jgi:hypothetical protein
MDLDRYYDEIARIAQSSFWGLYDLLDLVKEKLNKQDTLILEMLSCRRELLDDSDKQKIKFLLSSTYFERYETDERLTLFTMINEIQIESSKYHYLLGFEQYHPNQKLFVNEPGLFDCIREREGKKDFELIKCEKVNLTLPGTEILIYNKKFMELDWNLPPQILTHFWKKYGPENLFVRINPHVIFSKHPGARLNEEVLIPPNPYWIDHLKIYNGKKEGSSFILEELPENYLKENNDDESRQKYWEKTTKKVIRLDVHAKRSQQGNLSMMLEELSGEILESHGLLVGRCIHLDSDDGIGVSFKDAELNHLDCAINLYHGDSILKRLDENLADGTKVVDAKPRIHLLRAEKIPFKELVNVALMFFQSQYLTKEWISYQFKE